MADHMAKKAAYINVSEAHILPLHKVGTELSHDKPYTEMASVYLRELQETTLPGEKERWSARGCRQSAHDLIYHHTNKEARDASQSGQDSPSTTAPSHTHGKGQYGSRTRK